MSSSTASKLDGLNGLESAKRLVAKISRGDVGIHAILFYGVRGAGKRDLARILAQAWLCLTPGDDGADGTCRACGAFERGNSADFLHVEPQGPSRIIRDRQITHGPESKPEDPQPLREFFQTRPIASRHKVAWIEDAHRMNNGSSNALLKTLEEPFPHARLILTTDSVGGLLPTILSRCLAVACELPAELQGVDADLSRLAAGSPGLGADLMRQPELYRDLIAFAEGLPRRPLGEALKASEQLREIADRLNTAQQLGVRQAGAQVLELLAQLLARNPACPPWWAQEVIEAHKRIVGNANAAFVFDALFASLFGRSR